MTDSLFRKLANKYETVCKNLKAAYTCTAPCTERNRILVEDIKPLVYDIWLESSLWTSIKDSFKNIASNVKNWFKDTFTRRRLLGSSSYEVILKLDNANGEKLITQGKSSGINLKDAGLSIISMISCAFFLILS